MHHVSDRGTVWVWDGLVNVLKLCPRLESIIERTTL